MYMWTVVEERRVLEEFFEVDSNWSLIAFLRYREGTDSFTYDKRREYKLYARALNALSKDHVRAQGCLASFEHYGHVGRDILTTPRVASYRALAAVDVFWTRIEKKRYEDSIATARASGMLHILEATNKSQKYVTNIQHEDFQNLYQPRNSRQDKSNENAYLRKRKDIDYNEERMIKKIYCDDGYVTPLQHSLKDSLSSPSETSQYFPSDRLDDSRSDNDFTSEKKVIDFWISYFLDELENQLEIECKDPVCSK
ncbi:8226_t:CDS:2 [Paraglomus occultum]|uniref:8226_t:CDS:1 n=1 Tax=Paraglomus occultum TaxID=144539 RepID=A0A9N9F529_9GLOM|nr:8226_t:CDS:2 [Paraglomus occultum]